jgi:hypothetical protein
MIENINVTMRYPPEQPGHVFFLDTDSGELYRVLDYNIYKKLTIGNHTVAYSDTPSGIRTIVEVLNYG